MKEIEFSWEQYQNWIDALVVRYDDDIKTCFVAIYRGSLMPVVHLNNIIDNSEMCIVKYQTYDGDDKTAEMLVLPDNIKDIGRYVIIDDICDTGNTMRKVCDFMDSFIESACRNQKDQPIMTFETMIDKGQGMGHYRVSDEWVVFPWEK